MPTIRQATNPTFALGVDIGGTKIEGSLIDQRGGILRTERRATPASLIATLELIEDLVARLSGDKPILGVGFSLPGSLEPATGLLRNAPNSPAINGTTFTRDLEERLAMPLAFENDANCMAMSELRFGAARGYRDVVGVILGTGVGAGVVLNGQLLRGARGLAPEPGHMPLDIGGRPCLCGNNGCAEAYLSGPSLLKRVREIGGGATRTEDIFNRPDDPASAFILAETRYLFARFIATLVSLYDPEIFVLGGGLSRQALFYETGDLITRFTFGTQTAPLIAPAQAGDASGKLGAAAIIFQRFGVA